MAEKQEPLLTENPKEYPKETHKPPPPMSREDFHRIMVFDAEMRKTTGVGIIDLKALSLVNNYQHDYRSV